MTDSTKWKKLLTSNYHSFRIDGTLPNLNDFIDANRVMVRNAGHCFSKGNELKQSAQRDVQACIRRDLKGVVIENPINITYCFYEPNRRRDKDNIAAFAMKVIQDALVKEGVIKNDGWKEIYSFECYFDVDKLHPRIEVRLEELNQD